jgi:hypothetical protein
MDFLYLIEHQIAQSIVFDYDENRLWLYLIEKTKKASEEYAGNKSI